MGTERSDYVIYGFKLPYSVYDENEDILRIKQDEYDNDSKNVWGENPFKIVVDVVACDYIVFGIVLAMNCSYSGWDFCELNFKITEKQRQIVSDEFVKVFLNLEHSKFELIPEPKLFIFSSWS